MQEIKARAKKYHLIKNWLFLAHIVLSLAGLLFLLSFGLSVYAKEKIILLTRNSFWLVAIYVFILDGASFLLSFPLCFYEGFILEHKFNLSSQKFPAWLKDTFKKQLIELLVFLVTAEVLYLFLRKTQDNWWIYAALFWIFLSVVFAKLTPILLIPLFFKSSPVQDENLKAGIRSLVDKSGSKIKNIFIIDFSKKTKKSNAMVCGLGKNRRILLADNLVNEFDTEQVCSVVAHELGHEVYKDTLRLLIAGSIFSFFSFFACDVFLRAALARFGFKEIYDIAAFPLLAFGLSIVSLFILPFQNGYSRRRESFADLFALELTNDPLSFISMMKKLGEKNLADFSPNRIIEFLLYAHPPIEKRIRQAERFYKGEERRKYARMDTVLPVELQINRISALGAEIIFPWQQGFTQDISYGGVALRVNFLKQDISGLGIGKIKVFLRIHLPRSKQPVSAQAQLIWIKSLPEAEGSYMLGLSFESIRSQDRLALIRFARWRRLIRG
ncbi:MAG: M48 family metalloprotease [Candidatus Omnitrophota bacterium]|nr:M48 family metalloprotease [Candidatus Omnitrophota bacterium]